MHWSAPLSCRRTPCPTDPRALPLCRHHIAPPLRWQPPRRWPRARKPIRLLLIRLLLIRLVLTLRHPQPRQRSKLPLHSPPSRTRHMWRTSTLQDRWLFRSAMDLSRSWSARMRRGTPKDWRRSRGVEPRLGNASGGQRRRACVLRGRRAVLDALSRPLASRCSAAGWRPRAARR